MNFYVVVEGEVGEKLVYGNWIPYANPKLTAVTDIAKVTQDNYLIVAGGGYPCLFEVINDAIADIQSLKAKGATEFDRLVIAVDSEEMTRDEKYAEIKTHVDHELLRLNINHLDYAIIVQNFCLETWALGNRKIVTTNVKDASLNRLLQHHNVSKHDPESLTPPPSSQMNRAQTATVYLRKLINNKFRGESYTKGNPSVLLNKKYFDQVFNRRMETKHITSFGDFLAAFR